jgi:hypothetical protein
LLPFWNLRGSTSQSSFRVIVSEIVEGRGSTNSLRRGNSYGAGVFFSFRLSLPKTAKTMDPGLENAGRGPDSRPGSWPSSHSSMSQSPRASPSISRRLARTGRHEHGREGPRNLPRSGQGDPCKEEHAPVKRHCMAEEPIQDRPSIAIHTNRHRPIDRGTAFPNRGFSRSGRRRGACFPEGTIRH